MNKKFRVVLFLLISAVCLCILITCIVFKAILSNKEASTMKKVPMEVLFDNAYINSQDDGQIVFMYKGDFYAYKGEAESECTGIADIFVKNGEITQIVRKTDRVSGNLLKYKDGIMYIQKADGTILEQPYNSNFSVYSLVDGELLQLTTQDLVFGASELDYVMQDGKICALIQNEPCKFDNIRVLIKNGASLYFDSSVYCTEENGLTYLCDNEGNKIGQGYVGTIELLKEKEGTVVINTLPVEEYVKYVTPSEMPYTWPQEALKTQAVCARTYAYAQMKNDEYAAFGANLDNTVSYQVYNHAPCQETSTKAANDTQYQVLTCEGKLITCYFFSTCTGFTNEMEVWVTKTPPYIHSVKSNDEASNLYQWNAKLDLNIEDSNQLGQIEEIKVRSKNEAGYITDLMIVYENGVRVYTNEYKLRQILAEHMTYLQGKDESVYEGWKLLPSAAFTIENNENGILSISGSGYGHGIGMSQYGARAMAEDGYTYDEILSYYYDKVKLTDIREIYK